MSHKEYELIEPMAVSIIHRGRGINPIKLPEMNRILHLVFSVGYTVGLKEGCLQERGKLSKILRHVERTTSTGKDFDKFHYSMEDYNDPEDRRRTTRQHRLD